MADCADMQIEGLIDDTFSEDGEYLWESNF